jgi:phosphoribosylglycinamide formyltransferase-1
VGIMLKIAILGSTRGTSLQAVINAIKDEDLTNVEISFVLSDKREDNILKKADNNGIKTIYLDPEGKSREEYDNEVDKLLQENNIDLVLLIGYMRLMTDEFVEKWRNKAMNIHPSLLPAYAGGVDMKVHEDVLKRGCKVSGCSLIFIDEGADTGPIILQKVCSIDIEETAETLKAKVQKLEGKALIEGIKLYKDRKLKVENGKVHILGGSKWNIKKLLSKILPTH